MHCRSGCHRSELCRLVWKILHRGIRYEERGPEVSKASKQKRTQKMIQALRNLVTESNRALLNQPSLHDHDLRTIFDPAFVGTWPAPLMRFSVRPRREKIASPRARDKFSLMASNHFYTNLSIGAPAILSRRVA